MQRAMVARVDLSGTSDRTRFGKLSGGDARRLADAICTKVTGESAQSLDATHQTAYSQRRGKTVREWNVLCNTPAALYLVRINANTGRVYGINRMEEGGLDAAVALARLQGDPKSGSDADSAESSANGCEEANSPTALLQKPAAEARAKRYLRVAGIASGGLHPLHETASCGSAGGGAQWNFTYRRRVPGLGNRLVKVSVDGKSGQLTHMWNPALAL